MVTKLTWNVKPSNKKIYAYSLLVILGKLVVCESRCNRRLIVMIVIEILVAVTCIIRACIEKYIKFLRNFL